MAVGRGRIPSAPRELVCGCLISFARAYMGRVKRLHIPGGLGRGLGLWVGLGLGFRLADCFRKRTGRPIRKITTISARRGGEDCTA